MSTPGECVWTCDLISKQTCPCQPESCRRCASCTPKQAFLRPGAGEPAGLPAPVRRGVCISASCLPAARHRCCTTDVTNLLSLCAWLLDYFWMGERAGALPLAPWCHSREPGGRWMGLLLFLALSFAKPPKGWTPHSWLSWSRSLSNWQRWMCKDCSFPPLWGLLANNKQKCAVKAAALAFWRWCYFFRYGDHLFLVIIGSDELVLCLGWWNAACCKRICKSVHEQRGHLQLRFPFMLGTQLMSLPA